jgi:hypothetical protein
VQHDLLQARERVAREHRKLTPQNVLVRIPLIRVQLQAHAAECGVSEICRGSDFWRAKIEGEFFERWAACEEALHLGRGEDELRREGKFQDTHVSAGGGEE